MYHTKASREHLIKRGSYHPSPLEHPYPLIHPNLQSTQQSLKNNLNEAV
ncbi:MAG: hypothetical protein K2X66_11365 [Cyanobacteria bacterium]|nr:hypothetical protein [Cyanobacteriota bacterium]